MDRILWLGVRKNEGFRVAQKIFAASNGCY